jgi:CheY-like chemotaxis protein
MPRRVLVADDEKEARLLWSAVAESEGYSVVEASDGRAALDALNGDETFDIVVLDVMMPFLDGYEVLRHMREDARLKSIPVIISTADRTTQELEGVYSGPGIFFINKSSGLENMRRGMARAAAASGHAPD